MSEHKPAPTNGSEIAEVQGEVYSRPLAQLMAEDIQLLDSLAPNSWAVGDNSALTIGRTVALSIATPIKHGVMVDLNALDSVGKDFALQGASSPISANTTLISVHSDTWTSSKVDLIRQGHLSAVRQLAIGYGGRCRIWRWLNDGRLQALEKIVGRPVPKPGYFDELLTIRASEADSPMLSAGYQPGRPEPFFRYVAKGIVAAHEANPNSWSIYNVKSGLTLSISGYSAIFIANERADLLLDGTPDDPEYESLGGIRKNTSFNLPVFRLLFDRRAQLAEYLEEFEESFLSAIRVLAATTKNVTPRQAEFQPRLLRYIEEQTGLSLPRPAYFDDQAGTRQSYPRTASNSEVEEGFPSMSTIDLIRLMFSRRGLSYEDHQISAFYTALQTKGFVVLSGISGTGKSKIATGFVDLLPSASTTDTSSLLADDDPILFTVRPYMTKRRQLRIASKYLDRFPSFDALKTFNIPITVNNISGTGNFRYEFMSGNPSISIWMHKSLYEAMDQLQVDAEMVLEVDFDDESQDVISARIFPLTSSISTGDTVPQTTVSNHLFLSVRPDWRDSTSLLGYYNPLTASYEWTDFLKFILQAAENYKGPQDDRIAWFVILDEMNLAHVEYYFADLLSVIESGRDADGWSSEPLRFAYPDALEDDEVPPREVKLPPNLYLIGTVNMDETTHAFSPKVLDRAFTIELTEVDFSDYPPTPGSSGDPLDDATKQALLQVFSRHGKFARIDKAEIADFISTYPEVREWLQALNERLAQYRMHFGYRVFDEIVQYLANNEAYAQQPLEVAFDQAVTMKVLPKFTGSRARLENPLQEVLCWAIDPHGDAPEETKTLLQHWSPGTSINGILQTTSCKQVARRVADMLATLDRDGFVSFG